MYKIQHDEKRAAPDGTKFNDFPVGWREITVEQFVRGPYLHRFVPDSLEYRQMYQKDAEGKIEFNKPYVGAMLFWLPDGTGCAMVDNHRAGTVAYFAFGCQHKYHELTQEACRARNIYHAGKCYHVSECEKCHNISAVDSSD